MGAKAGDFEAEGKVENLLRSLKRVNQFSWDIEGLEPFFFFQVGCGIAFLSAYSALALAWRPFELFFPVGILW